jgi:pimeloyl-ACP methyl ester carboxylesterase
MSRRVDTRRRQLLTTGAAAAAGAAVPRALAQQAGKGAAMPIYQRGDVRIHYQEAGSGFPLLVIPGGGLNSSISFLTERAPFNAMEEFKGEYRCIVADLRNAHAGQSTGPLEVDRPWESFADDQLGLMDHLGIKRFMALGYCIGSPFIWGLMKRAPDRIVAAVHAQPVGFRPEASGVMYENSMKTWAPEFMKRRPEITQEMVDRFLTRMYRTNPDFVFTVTRDFVRNCQTPILVMPDDIPSHPYAVAMEVAKLAPKSEVSFYPWKEPKEMIPLAVRQVRSFLRAHRPAA